MRKKNWYAWNNDYWIRKEAKEYFFEPNSDSNSVQNIHLVKSIKHHVKYNNNFIETEKITEYTKLLKDNKNLFKFFKNMSQYIQLILDDFKKNNDETVDLNISNFPIPSIEKLLKLTKAKLQKDSERK